MKYVCSVCGYIYDEEKENILFADLPDGWVCPVCKAPKAVFSPLEEEKKSDSESSEVPEIETELKELSAGELSVVFSNLARGCEKQYKKHEAELFAEIAAYFKKAVPVQDPSGIEELAERIRENLEKDYPLLEKTAAAEKDRGTLRAYTWGNKVTTMQKVLVDRYLREGEAFLEHTNVWVCTVCGFIYIGEEPPALCPVCKVPDWKFKKIEGGVMA